MIISVADATRFWSGVLFPFVSDLKFFWHTAHGIVAKDIQVSRCLKFVEVSTDDLSPRVGGPALIGGILEWPLAPDDTPLTLVVSIPASISNFYAGTHLAEETIISVFSYYAPKGYFLDSITYHGDRSELKNIKDGYTKVIVHSPGNTVFGDISIPAMRMDIGDANIEKPELFTGSKIGAPAGLLQCENLNLGGNVFALQLYGGDFPQPYSDIFFLSDAVGYVFLPDSTPIEADASGLFFVQTG